ncbi:MAG: tetratricopeptide repeat protein [Bacteroidota bacterium]
MHPELSNRAKALISHFSNGKFQMPFEIVIEKEIGENGIENGVRLFNEIKKDTINYSVSESSLFSFAIDYINNNQNKEALKLFEQLIEDYPSYFGGYYGKAIAHKELGEKDDALEYLKHTIEICSNEEKWAKDHSEKMIQELKK